MYGKLYKLEDKHKQVMSLGKSAIYLAKWGQSGHFTTLDEYFIIW